MFSLNFLIVKQDYKYFKTTGSGGQFESHIFYQRD